MNATLSNQACGPGRPFSVAELLARLKAAGMLDEAALPDLAKAARESRAWSAERAVELVCIDSRAVAGGSLFVALRGERADGHDYLEACAAQGAVAALVSAEWCGRRREAALALARSGCLPVAVADPLAALQELARQYLASLPKLRRIGVTGSSGKTTTKDLIAAALSAGPWRVFATKGNLNSVIGLPLAALALPPETDIAVFEMAMSERGEMATLADIVLPDLAVVTNIGLAHIGNIGSQEQIAKEKKAIFGRFDGNQAAVLPADDPWCDFLADGVSGDILRYGESATPGYAGSKPWKFGQALAWRGLTVELRLPGAHNRLDALAAIAVAERLGMRPEDVKRGLESFQPSFGRSEILEGGVTLVQDCYNANPDSMESSIAAFAELPLERGSRVLVLGDMLELGSDSAGLHARIGRLAATSGADVVLFCGAEMQAAYNAASALESAGGLAADRLVHLAWFETRDQLAPALHEYVDAGDLVLLKASRGMAMEKLSPILLALRPAADEPPEPEPDVEPELMARYLVADDDPAEESS